jgi:Peptidase A4 family
MGMNSGARGKLAKSKAAAAGLLLAAALVPATAGTSAAASVGFGPQSHHYQDSNWGGYVAQGSFSSVSGSWTEPSVTCNSTNDLFAPWVGIDGYGSSTVEQTGVQTDCSSGAPVLSAWYEMYPAAPVYFNDPVSEGDNISASVVSNGGGSYTLTISDNTKGWSEHLNKSLSADNVSAEAVIESPTSSYPSFSSLTFSNVQANGQALDNFSVTDLESGGYGPSPLSGGTFSMSPGFGAAHHSSARPGTVRY